MSEELVRIDSLFLHDTQMADLDREQARLRALAAKARAGFWLPVTFTQTFCPYPRSDRETEKPVGKLVIGKPVADAGWIIRPVSFEGDAARNGEATIGEENSALDASGRIAIPFYPALPRTPGFILGFADPERPDRAGAEAEELAARLRESAGDFSVNVWYRAELALRIRTGEGRCWIVERTVDEPSWEKARTTRTGAASTREPNPRGRGAGN